MQECDGYTYDDDIMCFPEKERQGWDELVQGPRYDKDPEAFKQSACCKLAGAVPVGDTCPAAPEPDSGETGTKDFLTMIEEKEVAVKELAEHVRRHSSGVKKCRALANCLDEVPCHHDSCGLGLKVGPDEPVCSVQNVARPDACPSGDCEGRVANMEHSTIVRSSYNKDPILTLSEKEMVCSTSGLDEVFKSTHDDDTVWSYFGSHNGIWRAYPGDARTRTEEGCREYDPRVRPWYLSAASGSKNLVILIDVSGSMNSFDGDNFESRMDLVRDAVTGTKGRGLLDTVTQNDRISVVTFSSRAQGLLEEGLVTGTADNISKLKGKVQNIRASGATYSLLGFKEAFTQLIQATRDEVVGDSCNNIVLYLTDGVDTVCENCGQPEHTEYGEVQRNGACRCNTAFHERIEQYQSQLESIGGRRAEIFSLSMGSSADDTLPRQLACQNGGAWDRISAGDNVLDKLESYLKFQSMDKAASDAVFWSEPYDDDITGDQVVTAAVPVYEDNEWRNLLGVAGVDILMEPLIKGDSGMTRERILNRLQSRSRVCTGSWASECDLQMLRDDRACPAMAPPARKEPDMCCMKGSNDGPSAIRVTLPMSWGEANDFCKGKYDGVLADWNTRSLEDLSELAGFAPPDGAWIHLKKDNRNGKYVWGEGGMEEWGNMQLEVARGGGLPAKVYGVLEADALTGNTGSGRESCGFISPTGMVNNVNFADCSAKKEFICYLKDSNADEVCSATSSCAVGEDEDGKGKKDNPIAAIIGGISSVSVLVAIARIVAARRRAAKQNKSNVSVVCCSSNVQTDSHDTQVDHDERGKRVTENSDGRGRTEVEMARQQAPVQVTVNVAAPAGMSHYPATAHGAPPQPTPERSNEGAFPAPIFTTAQAEPPTFGEPASAPPTFGEPTSAPGYAEPPTSSYLDKPL